MSEQKDPAVKPEGSEHISLRVVGTDGSSVTFKIKKQTQLKKLMTTYCDRTGSKLEGVRFMFDGQHIREEDRPTDLDMEDDDTIEVFQQQTGGF